MMNKIFSFMLCCLCQVTMLAQIGGVDGSYNPSNPPNPEVPETKTKYMLTTTVSPLSAGSTNYSSGEQLTEGTEIYISTSANTGFVFQGWFNGDTLMSTTQYFYYVMPAWDVKLRAVYKYDPTSPANPETPVVSYNLTLVAQPARGGSFNQESRRVQEGELTTLYAYSNTGYRFVEWQLDGQTISYDERLEYTMPSKNTTLTAVFRYDPTNPANPGKNSWDSSTGEVIIDDFTPGYLGDAIYQKTNGNYDAVTQIIVAGKIGYNDFGIANNYENCTYLDFSRTTGITAVPSYTYYYNSTLSTIVLPASIEKLEYMAFYNCSNLTEIRCYAPVPPVVESNALDELQTGIIVRVPSASVALYQEAEGWKDLTILPFEEEANALQVNLPESSIDGRYKNMYIELLNTNSGQKLRNVLNDRMEYVFGSLMKNTQWNVYLKNAQDVVLATIEGVEIKDENVVVTFENALVPRNVTLTVVKPDQTDVTSQSTIRWKDANDVHLSQGAKLKGMIDGTELKYSVGLPQALAMEYKLPAEQTYVVSENTDVLVVLGVLPTTTVSGVIRDVTTGQVISGAVVSISQTVNGLYSKSQTVRTDENGAFVATIFVTEFAPDLSVTCSATEYISQTFSEQALTLIDGAYSVMPALKSITGTTISLGFTYTTSSVDGKSGDVQEGYSDYANVSYSIYNKTKGKSITEFNVQYPNLIILEEVAEGDVLQLTASSRASSFVPVTTEATVDAQNQASATFNILQYGQISAKFTTTKNSAVIGILYDKNGKLVSSQDYIDATVSFDELPDGEYTLVSMAKSSFFNSIYSFEQFSSAGMKRYVDYIQNTVTVESGVICQINNSVIPFLDESKLYYTGDNTSFMINKTQVTAGNYLTLTGHIDFKDVYASSVSDVKLIVDLPTECRLVDGSIMVGTAVSNYTTDGNSVLIPLSNYADRIRFCITPLAGGTFSPNAYVRFMLNNKEVTQPIGSVTYTVQDLCINVPSVVANINVPVSGVATGKSTIDIYDNDMLVGKTTALANGTYATAIELVDSKNLSIHRIYAKVKTPSGVEMQTETVDCLYDVNSVGVNTVTMINTAHTSANLNLHDFVTVFDFKNPGKPIPAYWYWPDYPDFTFLIDLSYHDKKLIPFVWLHVFMSDGKVRSLRADYNSKKDCWMAIDKFNSDALPTRVSVSIEDMRFDLADIATYELLMDQYVGEINLKETIEEEDGSVTSIYTDENGDDIASISSFESDLTQDELVDIFKNEGFEEDELLNDDSGYVPEDEDDVLEEDIKVLVEPKTGSLAFIGARSKVAVIRIIQEEDKQTVRQVTTTMTGAWKNFFREYFDEKRCAQVTIYKKYYEYLEKYSEVITSSLVAYAVFIDYRILPPGIKIPKKEILAKIRRVRESSRRYTETTMEYSVVPKSCPPPTPPTPPTPPHPPVGPVMDPSGYVYEGVSSNRLEGVTATAYYKETTTNIYGDEEERIVLWDATDYGQENPLFTDEYGMYAWDVPQGMWQVKFEKEGYQTVYSEWLPVPPPQMDVNIAMVQAVQPKVVGGRAYKDGVEVEFDKYMMPESLTTDNIQVTKDGEKVDGTIEMLNAEKISDSDATVYASRVKFVPAEGVNLSSSANGKITLSVNTKVKSYAGLQLQESYQQEFDVEIAVSNIDVEPSVNVVYGGDDRELSIKVLPEDAAKGKTLTVKASSTLFVNVTADEKSMDEEGVLQVVLDEHGRATITLTGEMPGTTMLSYSVEDADVTAQTVVNVKTEELMNTEPPVASRASGSALYRGTEIYLTCPTKDAVIYYTTDGSCPCDEDSRLTYDENTPIIIDTDELTIKAIAQGNDMYDSEMVEFTYTIRETTVGMNLYEGWTWVSHNVKESQNAKEIFSDAVEVKSLTKGLIKDPVYGLVGNLDKLLPTESYKVKMDAPKNVEIYGEEFNAESDYITLKQGWNWVGFPIGQQLGLNEAFRTDPVEGDEIVGLEGYAEFIAGEWIGSLLKLIPGQGYLYSSMSDNSLLYNTSIVSRAKSRFGHGLDINKAPWAANIHQYPNVMPVTANLFVNDEKADADTYSIGAFCGTECRGVGKYVNGILFMSVHGDNSEDITFVASDNETGKLYDITESMSFSADRVGSYNAPYALHLGGEATAMTELNSKLAITPGVVRDFITIEVPSESIDCITIFNMSGTPVIIQKDMSVPARINVAQLPEGTYIVSVSSGGSTYYQKVIKVN